MVHRTPFFLPWLYSSLIWRMPGTANDLYLTFDDGPVPGPTEFVLETLKKYAGHATFFCIGENIRKHPKIFREIHSNGHTIGNHTHSHINGWKTETNAYYKNIRQCNETIDSQMDKSNPKPISLFRPPFGRIKKGAN